MNMFTCYECHIRMKFLVFEMCAALHTLHKHLPTTSFSPAAFLANEVDSVTALSQDSQRPGDLTCTKSSCLWQPDQRNAGWCREFWDFLGWKWEDGRPAVPHRGHWLKCVLWKVWVQIPTWLLSWSNSKGLGRKIFANFEKLTVKINQLHCY